ncbi:sensor histidine kinase [Dysgonomonas sp. ZJ279]|uniref:sensor histidine kinase n=1 Tax=Dysgonomonas sp. ZJ279 TaxID=2709796 RepID=UPI0013EA4D0C|nr:histidine kinase [Dysgonomonas sp. ZJ279]
MRTRLLITLLALTSIFAQARDFFSLKDLQPNDTFRIKITLADGIVGHSSIWDFDQVQKIEVQFDVLSVHKDSIRLGVKPTNWFAHFQDENQYNPYSLFQFYSYYDSYFLGPWNGEKGFYLFKDNNVVVAINKNNGDFSTTFIPIPEEKEGYGHVRRNWYSDLPQMSTGLKIRDNSAPFASISLDFEKVLNASVQGFIGSWIKKSKDGNPMPWFVDLMDIITPVVQKPIFVQIVSASFDLYPNIHLSYKPSKDIPEDRIFIVNGSKKIRPIKKEPNGTYIFNFFISSPKRLSINDILLDVTPDDSQNIIYNTTTNNYTFEGKGSANSAYTNAIVKLYSTPSELYENNRIEELTPQQIDDFFKLKETSYKVVLANHAKGMNKYWIRSAELSYDYWFASQRLYLDNEMTKQNLGRGINRIPQHPIPWYSPKFANLFPITDYLYQPYTYDDFLNNYFSYKAWQTNDDMLTGMRYLQEHIPKYYFADAIFWGYPRFYLTGETLKYLMTGFHLSDSQREYEDFLRKCYQPEIRETIIAMREQLEKVEPGANIKNLDLAIQQDIPLKDKADGYIVLLVDDEFNETIEGNLKNTNENIDKENLKDKIKLCIITSDSQKAFFNDKTDIHFVSDTKLYDYYDKVISRKGDYIIMRDDGTIIDRTLGNYNDSGHFITNIIKTDIEKQKNQHTASNGMLTPVILSSLFSMVVTFFIVRLVIKRRERIRRHISELELKAIRAQMNPHFTFNALGSIQNLINQKKNKEANDYLVNFAKLLRMVLSTSEKRLISLSEEIEQLELYLRLEQLRVPFLYTINVDKNIYIENEEIPGMLIQPIVENAIKHGIVPKGGGQIKLNFNLIGHVLYVIVTDSGSGCFQSENTSPSGFGLQAVHERLKLLSKELNLEIGMKIENIATDGKTTGCMVTISIPV